MDISSAMLEIADQRVEESQEGPSEMDEDSEDEDEDEMEEESDDEAEAVPLRDLLLHDMGEGVCFRAGTFDGCISISALQWLCHSNKSSENPKGRLTRLFATLFASLARGARAVFQFYPETPEQIDLILGCATKAGFSGGLVVDYPNSTKSKKYYLVLMTGTMAALPKAKTGEEGASEDEAAVAGRVKPAWRDKLKAQKMKEKIKGKDWVMQKKELYRKRGREVPEDSKFTARKRRPRF
jgi:18S rRNA (guanine1575-N7)-methyltransferase